ncbi:NGG1p interacting factor NIF3 [Salinispirillum sp. LH 10-3-1]|uniref:NGG1p interacting factor NIF3 n=1 Tax=Salinispirillum sp. LH 10-3-1 TaxID=2952525 RepID=A0AB38YCT4_9GAMM
MTKFYKLIYFVPESHLEKTKLALFAAGAGQLGDYDCCAWQVKGQGQFRPLAGAHPHVGQVGEVEYVSEYRVELLVAEGQMHDALKALRQAHPYEEPAYEIIALVPSSDFEK